MEGSAVTFDLYAWKAPRDLDAGRAESLVRDWQEAGGEPAASPFEPSADVGWFYRELLQEQPGLETVSDAAPPTGSAPIWLATGPDTPARVVAMRLPPVPPRDVLDAVFGLAAKYDLVLYDRRSGGLHLPLEAMAAYASATFWPRGAIQAGVAGGIGGVVAVVAWLLGIPVMSGLVALVGGFLFVMAVVTFVHEGLEAMRRRQRREPPRV